MGLKGSRPSRVVLLGYGVALLLLHYDYPRFPSPNERTRLYLLDALVHHHGLAIDAPIARFGDLEDKLVVGGRTLSNKPPGLAALALPAYFLADRLAHLLGRELDLGWALYLSRLAAASLPAFLFLGALEAHLRRTGLAGERRALLLAGIGFGSGLLPYGGLFMSHAAVAACLGGQALLLLGRPGPAGRLAAGLLAGTAAACEYPAAVPAGVLLLWGALAARSGRAALHLALGVAPAALLVLGYNWCCFGNPLDLGYGHHPAGQFAAVHSRGMGGFGLPQPAALWGLALGRSKGLLAWTPLLLLAFPGALRLHRGGHGAAALALGGSAAALFLFLAGYPNWHGGWTSGPRYLVPAIPLLALLAAEALRDGRVPGWLPAGLAGYGIALHALPVLTWPFLPDLLGDPVRDLSWPLLRMGALAPTTPQRLGLPAAIGAAALLAAMLAALAVALRPRPAPGALLAGALLAAMLALPGPRGPVRFCRAEVLYGMGHLDAAARAFEELLARERPSPAMAEHARRRLVELYGAGVAWPAPAEGP